MSEILTTAGTGRCWCCACSGVWYGFLRNLQPLLRGKMFRAMITASPAHQWSAGDGCGGRHEVTPGLSFRQGPSVDHHPAVRRMKASKGPSDSEQYHACEESLRREPKPWRLESALPRELVHHNQREGAASLKLRGDQIFVVPRPDPNRL